jgi:hypothetical protein
MFKLVATLWKIWEMPMYSTRLTNVVSQYELMDIGVINISFCYTIVSNCCKVIKIVYKVVIDHAMITSRMVLLGNEHMFVFDYFIG